MGTFCGGNTKTWSLSLGIVMMVLLFIELIVAIVFTALGLLNVDKHGKETVTGDGQTANKIYGGVLILGTFIGLIITLFLIVGTIQMKKCLLMTWIVCSIIFAIYYAAVLGISILLVVEGAPYAAFDLAMSLLIVCLIIFTQFVVWELKQEAQ